MARSLYARLDQRFGTRPPAFQRQRDLQNRIANFAQTFGANIMFAPERADKKTRVAVVGAGFAGLMAGHTLSRTCTVQVFEARDRVGGRVWTQFHTSSHRVIEAGAELIGYNHLTWLRLAKHFGLGLSVLTTEEAFTSLNLDMPLSLDGQVLSPKQTKQVYDEMEPVIAKICAEARTLADPYKCWETPHAHDLDRTSLADWIEKQDCSRLAKKALEAQFANTNGAPTRRQSLLANLAAIRGGALHGKPDDYFTQSETVKCEQGNQTLAFKLAQSIEAAGGSVATNRPIALIDIRADKVTLKSAADDELEFDYVVFAVPPSLWPTASSPSDITITPAIPPDFHMSMGLAIKYLSELKGRFWFGGGLSPNGMSDAIGMTWDGTDNQIQMTDQSVELSLFAGGDAAKEAIELLGRSGQGELNAYYGRELEKLFAGYSGNLVSDPTLICWPAERWTGAGYSCPAPGEVTRIGPFLNRPFNERLVFAGEHCCLPFFGYMEGALQSGLAAASAITRNEGLI
ncbi:NAD(P)/FAD-dependent oxidoreductase [Bradyrhizobium sp. MOS001]|uniref:flavin monoamine oxidase family protein n=1 Tax=Bradyrhizobium sp. MOS001 TaxID=2133948 RepID=UPI00107555F4|nr:NAD(P)/FAD-dependent oxidoreductase [Bradyrhizobium sp. MOS001]TFW56517.1 NAD(P)/FAD-dependent oxidoreductase [Bradyrhizobium sp. MOS001]